MSLFKDPADEDKICKILKTYVEEFGEEATIIGLPSSWKDRDSVKETDMRVKMECNTKDTIEILVPSYGVRYAVQLDS